MTEGWGAPSWLPEHIRRRAVLDEAREQREARQAAAEAEQRHEQRRDRAMKDYLEDAQLRGDQLDVAALSQGNVPGRTVSEILTAASAAGDLDDRRTDARLHREGHGDPVPLQHVEFGEPQIHAPAARSEVGLKIFNQARHFRDKLEARRRAEVAEKAAIASRDDYGYVCPAPSRRGQ